LILEISVERVLTTIGLHPGNAFVQQPHLGKPYLPVCIGCTVSHGANGIGYAGRALSLGLPR
jgi:hypothetical protein